MCATREGNFRGVPIHGCARLDAPVRLARGFSSGAGATSMVATDTPAVCAAKPDHTCGARLTARKRRPIMPTDEDDDDIVEINHRLAVYANRQIRQRRELRSTLDTVLDACPADTITLLLLRGDPGLTKQIARWQQKHSG